jgi:hydroxymethylpyrimidine pyrophosphatase-like HAD family hydrolase
MSSIITPAQLSLRYLRPVVAFDIDETLMGYGNQPREDVIQFLKLFVKFGCDVVVWSNGCGAYDDDSVSYAQRIVKELGLEGVRVVEKGSLDPDITIDDLDIWTRISEGTLGRVNIRV